ncbi:MAG: hypothetical protein M1832_003374 [Thelocarpon impressellum]|nr:MAG: hypothetical protein M1832_003374 [Thelocarpon impressellum]
MGSENVHDLDSLPIPTYEEAISLRPASSQSHLGAEVSSDDAERQGLLAGDGEQPGSRAPAPRASDDSERDSYESLRHEISQMDVEEPMMDPGPGSAARMRDNLSKRLTFLTDTLSSINLPFQVRIPSLETIRSFIAQSSSPVLMVLVRLFALLLIFLLVYFVASEMSLGRGNMRPTYNPESVMSFVENHIRGDRIREHLEKLTAYDHLAGTKGDYALAEHVHGLFTAAKLDRVELNQYSVYLNYPRSGGRRVFIDSPDLVWEAQLEEDFILDSQDPSKSQTFVFHGHSRAGNVAGPLIYANYGSREDFRRLKDSGVDVAGSLVLVRYYGTQTDRALKVKAAEMAGAVGCLIYSDPNEDGFVKGEPWPKGRWMPSDGVQRGSVSLMSWVVGDVLTPGWASTEDAPRLAKDNNPGLVNIPSMPLAWRDAKRLLQVLEGHGQRVADDWVGGVPEVAEWWTGDKTSPVVHLINEQDEEEKQPIWNVLGSISGNEQREKTVIVGNHRDAWCLGAADPGSGTAIMLEVVAVFGELVRLGWRPRRSIQFASWDGEEYNLIGSTEWVEDNIEGVRRNGVAYINLDTAVTGDSLRAAASPLFQRALMDVLDRTVDPVKNQSLRALWEDSHSTLEGLGAGSDYVAFQDIAGTSSIDLGFTGPARGFPYHSCYDNFEWMKAFGDPNFEYHTILAKVLALLILKVADSAVLPFDFEMYAWSVHNYVARLQHDATEAEAELDLAPLREAADDFSRDARAFQRWEGEWNDISAGGSLEDNVLAIRRLSHNSRMSNFETHLLDLEEDGGIPGREQFKHVLFGPQAWSGYDEAYFPAVRDAMHAGNWTLAQQQVDKAADILQKASRKLLN